MLESLNQLLVGLAGEPWAYAVVLALCIVDAFFPPLPSESVVISMAALSLTGSPHPVLLWAVAAAGAFLGDTVAFRLGRVLGLRRRRWHAIPAVERAFAWAGRHLERRGGLLIIAARYVPVGRVAVNMTAGATGMGLRRFWLYDAIAATAWASWSVLIGRLAGQWVVDNPALGALTAVAVAITLGWAADRVAARFVRPARMVDSSLRQDAPRRQQGGGRRGWATRHRSWSSATSTECTAATDPFLPAPRTSLPAHHSSRSPSGRTR